jgi:uncharacterized cysteine cluster protein YcgN (CxxCxxCC family)
MPDTCGYRRVFYGEALEKWHPLISKNPNSATEADQTVADKTISEDNVNEEDLENFINEKWS